jgi:hypothetical protein
MAAGVGGGMWLDRQLRPAVVPAYQRLTFRRGVIRSARVTPDGQTILYGALWENSRCRVHTVRLDSPESQPLDLPHANILAISKSGEMAVALGGHEESTFTVGTLARVPLAGGAPGRLSRTSSLPTGLPMASGWPSSGAVSWATILSSPSGGC